MSDATIQLEGMDHLLKVTTPDLYRAEVQTIVSKGAIFGEGKAKEASPVDKGRLRGAITHRIGEMTAEYGVIGGLAGGGTVGVYGLALDKPVTRDPHYRGGPRSGSPTRGWFSDTRDETQEKVNELVQESIKKIESTWANG